MNKSQFLLKLVEDVTGVIGNDTGPMNYKSHPKPPISNSTDSTLQKFLNQTSTVQDVEIEKFRLKKQLHYMKKFANNPTNDKEQVGPDGERTYYWDANVTRVFGA